MSKRRVTDASLLDSDHRRDLSLIESAAGDVVVHGWSLPAGYTIPLHSHRRAQLLCSFSGVVVVESPRGRWIVPPGHALLIPARMEHAVAILSDMDMESLYVDTDRAMLVRDTPVVVEVSDLARSLLGEALRLQKAPDDNDKKALVSKLLVSEILELQPRPLGLPLPNDRRLAEICRGFVASPSPNERLDVWAERLGMSRRSFTRFFRAETGISFLTWCQQATVFASLPRLAKGASVTSVAMDAGYENPAAFATMFKRVLGTSPRAHACRGRAFKRTD